MFERFSESARLVTVHAQEEAFALGHGAIGSEHLLLGILRGPGDDVAAGVLDSLGVTLADAREQVVRVTGRGAPATDAGQMPFTRSAQRALEQSLSEARALGHRGVRTEHLLLALADDRDGPAARVLGDFDADGERIRSAVLRKLDADAATGTEMPVRSAPVDAGVVSAAATVPDTRTAGRTSMALGLAVGSFAFGAAVGIGLVLGWLIWG